MANHLANHLHERDKAAGSRSRYYRPCKYCGSNIGISWWAMQEETIAAVIAHGLPDHEERVAAVVAIAAAKGLVGEEYMTVEEVIGAYRAWQKEESGDK